MRRLQRHGTFYAPRRLSRRVGRGTPTHDIPLPRIRFSSRSASAGAVAIGFQSELLLKIIIQTSQRGFDLAQSVNGRRCGDFSEAFWSVLSSSKTLSTTGQCSRSPLILSGARCSRNCFAKKKPSSRNTTTITKRNNACLHRVRSGGAHMTTGKAFGQLWSHGARDWASFVEPHYRSLYQAVYDRLGITEGTRGTRRGVRPRWAALLASGRGARVAGLDASPDSIQVARERFQRAIFVSATWKTFHGRKTRLMLLRDLTPSHSLESRCCAGGSSSRPSWRGEAGDRGLFATRGEPADEDHGRDRHPGAATVTRRAGPLCPLRARRRGVGSVAGGWFAADRCR